jgi:hypothetical protein
MTKGRVIAAAAATLLFFLIAQGVSAQYPPPKGNLVCVLSETKATAGSLTLTATYRDSAGNPVVGKLVNFEVVTSGGTTTASGTTNASGAASLTVLIGNTTGQITIKASADDLECRGVAEVLGVSVFRPPSTGDGGLAVDVREHVEGLQDVHLMLVGAFVALILFSFWLVMRQG